MTVPTGGFSLGKDPAVANSLVVIAPQRDENTTILVPRVAWRYTFSFDPDRNGAIYTRTKFNTNLPYVGGGQYFQGGVAFYGGSNHTIWNQVKHVGSDGISRDLGFPTTHGANPLTITAMFSQGSFLIVDTAETDGSEAQRFVYFNGKWYAGWVLQSKSNAIATEPILWAESTGGLQQNVQYRFFPVSTTNLAAAREFVPADLTDDPHRTNTSQVKQNGALYTQFVELDVGPEEANKAILALNMQSRRVDDNTSYGSVRVRVDTGGDTAVASAEVDETFDAAAEILTDRNLSTTAVGDPGVTYRTQIVRLTLGHAAGSAFTPNGLPVLELLAMQWPHYETFAVVLDPEKQTISSPSALITRLKAESDSKVSQRFQGGGYDCPAVWEKADFQYTWFGLGRMQPGWKGVKKAVLTFRRVPGVTVS